MACRQTEQARRRAPLSLADFRSLAVAAHGGAAELAAGSAHDRLPWEGFTDEYRIQLAVAFPLQGRRQRDVNAHRRCVPPPEVAPG